MLPELLDVNEGCQLAKEVDLLLVHADGHGGSVHGGEHHTEAIELLPLVNADGHGCDVHGGEHQVEPAAELLLVQGEDHAGPVAF